jgi:MtrB/PioB family decaheme-associated outer membrane protein
MHSKASKIIEPAVAKTAAGRWPVVGSSIAMLLLPACLQVAAAEGPAATGTPAAKDPAVTALTDPHASVQIGVAGVSDDSFKFGEYNGLQDQGGYLLGNVDVDGGDGYDSDSARRWSLKANNVGLQTSDAQFNFREQGRFWIGLDYDQLRHNISDTYQSPYQGLGTTNFTLPGGWLKPVVPQANPTNLNDRALSPIAGQGSVVNAAGVVVPPTPAQVATNNAIVAADAGAYQNFDMHTQRRRGEAAFGVELGHGLLLTGSAARETRDGFKPISAVSSAVQENSVTLPDVVDTTTDQFNLGLQYSQGKGSIKAGYYGSIFTNDVKAISWRDPADATRTASMSSAPSNEFHQFNLTGEYAFTPTTRVVADAYYGRARQDQAFLSDPSLPLGLPATSADATVVTKLANIRFSMRPLHNLGLYARFKYDDRDDQTPVQTFVFYDVNLAKGATASPFNAALGLAPGTLSSNVNIFSNRPQSRQTKDFIAGADYSLGHGQMLSADFAYQEIDRTCDASWNNCTNAPHSDERALHVEWHGQLFDDLSGRLSVAHAERRVQYDSNAWLGLVPMANVIPGAPVVGATTSVYGYLTQTGLTGFGPLAGFPTVPLTGNAAIFSPGNNIVPQSLYGSRDNVSEIPGMRRFNMADRDRDRVRSSIEWQSTDRLSLQGAVEFDNDDYLHSQYGLQKSTPWNVSLDASYVLSDRMTINGFYTHEDIKSQMAGDGYVANSNVAFVGRAGNTVVDGSCYTTVLSRNLNSKLDPCLIWTADSHDRADTVGVTFARNGLMAHRLNLSADLLFTRAQTDIGVIGGSYANSPFALAGAPVLSAGVPAAYLIPTADLPPVVTHTFDLRLGAQWAVNKDSDVNLVYVYERSETKDFAYQGTQFGTGTEQLPTLEQAPDYAVNVIALYFRHRVW